MCENHLTVKREGWLLGVLNTAGKSLGKLYPTNYLAAVVVVVHLYQQVMKREHQKIKKKIKKKGERYLIKQVALWVIYYYPSSNVGTSQITVRKGKETGH